ncbi:MEDS domain-containing protein [Sporosarcina sp. CAU 1771]
MVEAIQTETRTKIQQLLESQHAHILYMYPDDERYIQEVLNYIEEGIAKDEYVLLVENERNYIVIEEQLRTRLTEEEMKLVRYVNSIDFYLSSGSYYPPAILAYFTKSVQWFADNKIPFRSWAHVEWATIKGPTHLIEQFERIVDEAVVQLPFSLICAYEENRISSDLQEMLFQTHPYILGEKGLNKSEKYILS